MNNNQYLAYLKTELGSHLYRMVDKDRSNNYYANQEKQSIKSVEIDGFFDFYLNTLKFTPKELVESLGGRESSLVEILYSTHYQKFEQRKSWINNFQEEIKNNTENLFFLSFQECIKNHVNNYDTNEIKDYYIKENFSLFKDLVNIGKEKCYFNNKNESYFHTLNKLYKDHLEQENVFSPQFNFTQLKQELTNHQPKNGDELKKYIHTYISDISEIFQSKSYVIEELAEKNCYHF